MRRTSSPDAADPCDRISRFLERGPWAVVGASRSRAKYGNKVLRCFLQAGRRVFPVNPNLDEVEGVLCHSDLTRLPERVHGVSIVTPPEVTARVVEDLPAAGARIVWMQPGAESDAAIARAEALGVEVIARGPCVLVALGFRDDA